MGYFDELKNECLKSLSWLLRDIEIIANRMKKSNNKKSILLLKRYVGNAYNDISSLLSSTLIDWQTLVYTIYQEERYEKFLSNLTCRFGPVGMNLDGYYEMLSSLCSEIIVCAGFTDVENYPFTVICGGDPYTTTVGVNQICLKMTDINRPWNWGIVAHELGHDIINVYYSRISRSNNRQRRRIKIRKSNPDPREVADRWISEIMCDIFGTLVAGPCLLSAHMMIPRIWCLMPVEEISLIEFFSSHPPDEIRFQIMNEILEIMSLKSIVDISEIINLPNSMDLENSVSEERELFQKRVKDVESITPSLLGWALEHLPNIKSRIPRIFTLDDWKKSCEIGKYLKGEANSFPENFRVIEIINGLVLAKRSAQTIKEEKIMAKKAIYLFERAKQRC